MGVGMPANIWLNEFGSQVYSAFGHPPYHVGASMGEKRPWRDVDVRLILPDDEYEAMELGDPSNPQSNAKWVALCLAFSALGKAMTGLPIDFQIQQRTYADKVYSEPRSALGIIPLRLVNGKEYAEREKLRDFAEQVINLHPELEALLK